MKPVSSRLEDYRSFSYPPSGPPVHTAHKLNKEKRYGPQTAKRKPKSKRVCHLSSPMPLASTLEPLRFMWPCLRNETFARCGSLPPLPRTCTPWPTGSLLVQSKRWPWNPQEFTGSLFSRFWSVGAWKFAWSTPAMSKGCRGAKPTSRIASGCNTSTRWDCCGVPSGPWKRFVRFAASCAIATTSSRLPRARCCSCKRPSLK